jgi:hypothetical protein
MKGTRCGTSRPMRRRGASPRPAGPKKPAPKPKRSVVRNVAACRIQQCWRSFVLRTLARRELVHRRQLRAVSRIERAWQVYTQRVNDRLDRDFGKWLVLRHRRLFHACIWTVRRAAIVRRFWSFIIGRAARRLLLRLRLHALFVNRKAWRIQRCYRRAVHRRATRLLALRCEELLWFLRVEDRSRSLLSRDEAAVRRQLRSVQRDPRAVLYAATGCATPTPPRRGMREGGSPAPRRNAVVHDFRAFGDGSPRPAAFACPASSSPRRWRPHSALPRVMTFGTAPDIPKL